MAVPVSGRSSADTGGTGGDCPTNGRPAAPAGWHARGRCGPCPGPRPTAAAEQGAAGVAGSRQRPGGSGAVRGADEPRGGAGDPAGAGPARIPSRGAGAAPPAHHRHQPPPARAARHARLHAVSSRPCRGRGRRAPALQRAEERRVAQHPHVEVGRESHSWTLHSLHGGIFRAAGSAHLAGIQTAEVGDHEARHDRRWCHGVAGRRGL